MHARNPRKLISRAVAARDSSTDRPAPGSKGAGKEPPAAQISAREQQENRAFREVQHQASLSTLKAKYGTATSEEHAEVDVLQAKMRDFWAQRMALAENRPKPSQVLHRRSPAAGDSARSASARSASARSASARSASARSASSEARGTESGAQPAQGAQKNPSVSADAGEQLQRKVGFEYELGAIKVYKNTSYIPYYPSWNPYNKGDIVQNRTDYDITADIDANGGTQVEFITPALDETKAGDRQRLINAATNMVADTKALSAKPGEDVRASDIPRLNGKWATMYNSSQKYGTLGGQLQMTGGLTLDGLGEVSSGRTLGQEGRAWHSVPRDRVNDDPTQQYKSNLVGYAQQNFGGNQLQPVWQAARVAANANLTLNPFTNAQEDAVAGVLSMMAQVPLDARGVLPGVNVQGQLLARTDFSKIMLMIAEDLGQQISKAEFETAFLATINAFGVNLTANDDVYPAQYRVKGKQMTGLTLGDWARSMIPTQGIVYGNWQGKDKLTKKNFPGTKAQKEELYSQGALGSKLDPGNKMIVEWRSIKPTHPEELVALVTGLMDYLRTSNT